VSVIQLINHSNTSSIQPNRIISLVPSQTELLYDLGLEKEVIGITKFCIHPNEWFKTKTRVGGTKNVDVNKVKSLQPTIVIANKEENVQEQVEAIAKFCPVIVTDINTLQDAFIMIESIGTYTQTQSKAQTLIYSIQQNFQQIKPVPKSVAYLIWKEPYMTVGGDTFISNILQACGFSNVFSNKNRYPITTIEELKMLQPNYVFLSSEPYPFKEKHVQHLQEQLPNSTILMVDGEMFSWYGSRLEKFSTYFMQSLAPLLN